MRSFKYIILSGKFGWRVWLQWWRLHGCWFDANFIRQYVRSASSISFLEKWQPTAAGSIDSSNVLSSGILMWVCRLFTYSQGNFIQSSWNVIKYLWKLVELHVWTSLIMYAFDAVLCRASFHSVYVILTQYTHIKCSSKSFHSIGNDTHTLFWVANSQPSDKQHVRVSRIFRRKSTRRKSFWHVDGTYRSERHNVEN